ncbi:MAG: hypothetical protein ACXVLQ_16805, partial [Bacteriovorax sp.]
MDRRDKQHGYFLVLVQLAFLLLFVSFSNLSYGAAKSGSGNGWVSSGGDNHPETAAWFTSSDKIRACIQRADDYPKSELELQLMIQKASSIWKNYYFNKVVPSNSQRKAHPQFDFVFSTCSTETEVTFYFAVENADVLSEMKKYYDPVAFATLQKYDYETGRGKGFVWFTDLSALDPLLNVEATQGLILHEIGHIYGNSHVSGTIMDEKIAEVIAFTGAQGGYPVDDPVIMNMMNSIDWKRPLYFDYQTLWNYQGHVPFDQLNQSISSKQKEILKSLFGREVRGPVTAQFSNVGPWLNLKLTLKDGLGSTDANLKVGSDANVSASGPSLFKVQGKDFAEGIQTHYYELFGSIRGVDGKIYSAIYTLN